MTREQAREKAKALVAQMTIEEAASQLRFDAPAIPRLGIPEYNWWSEGLHGVARAGTATVFPQAIGLGATFDKELLKEIGSTIATEARAKYNESVKHGDRDIYKGLTYWSPNLNLFRDPRWGRGHETYGEDPELISRLGVNFIEGLQGDSDHMKIAACAKHFAVHSGPEAERHHFDAKTNLQEMWRTYLPAFEAAVKEADVESVMGAYNRTNGEPCCGHTYLMQDVLRGKWGFEGHFVSDCWAVLDFHEHHKVTKTIEESAALALEKGCDLNCGCTYQHIMDAYDYGQIPEEHIRRAAVNLFTTRYRLGLSEETEFDSIDYKVVECKEHLALASRAAKESFVLLKNDGILPLKKEKLSTIGVIGPNADSRAALMGNYHGTSSRYITILEGIQDYVGDDVRVLYSLGCHLSADREEPLAKKDDRISEALTVAEHSDVVILCLGLDETLEGEEGDQGNAYFSGDKDDLLFPESQRHLLNALMETGKPIVLCVMAGSAMNLNDASEGCNGIFQVWYPGARGGADFAEILFGDVSPSGKLPITIYRDLEGCPDFTDYSMENRTYRFLKKAPLYPFGYGLTYGKTCVDSVEFCEPVSWDSLPKEVSVAITGHNDSNIDLEDVLQVYLHVEGTEDEVVNPRLVAFERIQLLAGDKFRLTIKIPYKAFETVDENGERSKKGTQAQLYFGFGQPDARTSELLGTKGKELTIS